MGMIAEFKIIHFTTVHPRTDTRIRIKQTATLAAAISAKVLLFVQDGNGSETDQVTGVQVIDTGPSAKSRFVRMTFGAFRMLRALRRTNPDIAHFHDPELIPVGLLLKLFGSKVVYDVHENAPDTVMKRQWIPHYIRKTISVFLKGLEYLACKVFDRIVVATPSIGKRFPSDNIVLIQNFPIDGELLSENFNPYESRPFAFAYVGGLTRERAAVDMLQALCSVDFYADVKLHIGGIFKPPQLKNELEKNPGWNSVVFHGWVDRNKMADILSHARAGLVLFHPAPNHIDSQPNKLFEYMSAGIPVIASDFPLWRNIVQNADCGLLVDPQNPSAIAKAMKWILDNPKMAKQMGTNGKRAVENIYNWENESKKLIIMYEELMVS